MKLNKEERSEKIKEIFEELLVLKESPLYSYRTKNKYFPVVGEGNHMAKIMFIGEAPGKNEAETGEPFRGASGKFLNEMLASVGLERKDVYITNIIKDRPPENRDPKKEEVELYAPFLDRQIEIIQPKIIVTLGRFSMTYILNRLSVGNKLKSISYMNGKEVKVTTHYGKVIVVPLYHPMVARYGFMNRSKVFKGFQVLKKYQ